MQSLVCMHSCKNITAALAHTIEAETARRASHRPVMVHQLREENLKEPKSSSSKGEKTLLLTYCATRRIGTSKKKHAHEVRISQLGCGSSNQCCQMALKISRISRIAILENLEIIFFRQ